jgi:hypothetical protein
MNIQPMKVTPQAIQELFEELENANGIHILTNQYIVLNYSRGQGPVLGHLERSLEFASEAQRQSLAFRREFFLELLFTRRDNGSVTRSN